MSLRLIGPWVPHPNLVGAEIRWDYEGRVVATIRTIRLASGEFSHYECELLGGRWLCELYKETCVDPGELHKEDVRARLDERLRQWYDEASPETPPTDSQRRQDVLEHCVAAVLRIDEAGGLDKLWTNEASHELLNALDEYKLARKRFLPGASADILARHPVPSFGYRCHWCRSSRHLGRDCPDRDDYVYGS